MAVINAQPAAPSPAECCALSLIAFQASGRPINAAVYTDLLIDAFVTADPAEQVLRVWLRSDPELNCWVDLYVWTVVSQPHRPLFSVKICCTVL
jgi:hypothetical protein